MFAKAKNRNPLCAALLTVLYAVWVVLASVHHHGSNAIAPTSLRSVVTACGTHEGTDDRASIAAAVAPDAAAVSGCSICEGRDSPRLAGILVASFAPAATFPLISPEFPFFMPPGGYRSTGTRSRAPPAQNLSLFSGTARRAVLSPFSAS